MRQESEASVPATKLGCSCDLTTLVHSVLDVVCQHVKGDDKPCAPHPNKCADKQDEAEQFDGESNTAGGSDGAKVKVQFQKVDEDQGRESVEEPE